MINKFISCIKNNKIVFVLLTMLISYMCYIKFVKPKSSSNVVDNKDYNKDYNKEKEGFISSDKFMGEMKGYVFKNDESGLGYYIDD